MNIRELSKGDRWFDLAVNLLLLCIVAAVFYPLYFVLIASVSEPDAVNSGLVLWHPAGFTLEGYEQILGNDRIWRGYLNSMIYMIGGSSLAVCTTALAGYALSHRHMAGRFVIIRIMVFTMYFNGGLIPLYLIVKQVGLVNNPLVVVILGSVSVYNIILVRSFYESNIPHELSEAAYIDGCGDGRFYFQVALPLSKPILAVMAIFYGVTYWNSYMYPLIFLNNADDYPLQIVLKDILIASQSMASSSDILSLDPQEQLRLERSAQLVKYGVILVSSLPVILLYPFAQKFFVKGVMIGSIKG